MLRRVKKWWKQQSNEEEKNISKRLTINFGEKYGTQKRIFITIFIWFSVFFFSFVSFRIEVSLGVYHLKFIFRYVFIKKQFSLWWWIFMSRFCSTNQLIYHSRFIWKKKSREKIKGKTSVSCEPFYFHVSSLVHVCLYYYCRLRTKYSMLFLLGLLKAYKQASNARIGTSVSVFILQLLL